MGILSRINKILNDDDNKPPQRVFVNRRGEPIKTETLVVQKPYCTPSRQIIIKALAPYGVKIYDLNERLLSVSTDEVARRMKIEARTRENLKYGPSAIANGWLAMAWEARVTVKAGDVARWAEYLLERTGRLIVVHGLIDPRNREWADRHNGKMPKPWIEPTCNSPGGMGDWKKLLKQAQAQSGKNSSKSRWGWFPSGRR